MDLVPYVSRNLVLPSPKSCTPLGLAGVHSQLATLTYGAKGTEHPLTLIIFCLLSYSILLTRSSVSVRLQVADHKLVYNLFSRLLCTDIRKSLPIRAVIGNL